MKIVRTFAVLFIIGGIAAILMSNYITEQVNEGKIKIAKGEKSVDQGNQLFSLNPYTKQLGQNMTNSAQKKINAGKDQVAEYQQLAQSLMTGGIIAIVVGGVMMIYSFVSSNKNRKR